MPARVPGGSYWFAGRAPPPHTTASSSTSTCLKDQVYARVKEAIHDLPSTDAIPGQQAALRELLHGRVVYSDSGVAGTSLASYSCVSKGSLPSSLASAPFLDEVMPSKALHFLSDSMERMLRPEEEFKDLQLEGPPSLRTGTPCSGAAERNW